jgi:cysteine desulfurase
MGDDLIYLDCNATTPLDSRVADAMRPYLERGWGNPSSSHREGREAKAALETARVQVATSLNVVPDEIVFTSGGSEADNHAILGVVEARGGGHVVTSAVEHPAVLEPLRALEAVGRIRLTVAGVDAAGRVDPYEVCAALSDDTVLVTVMLANNEVGTVQPVVDLVDAVHARGALLHTDAAQAVGKIPVDVAALGVDLLTVAGHKLYGPKGVGALVVRKGVEITPLIRGAGHERGLRAGTENVLGAVGLGAACELAATEVDDEGPRLADLRDRLRRRLAEAVPGLVEHGNSAERLPNTLSVAFPDVDSGRLMARLADEVAVSAGAACHAEGVDVSHVLTAMGVSDEVALGTVRFSVGRFTTADEVDRGAGRVLAALAAVRVESV